ncbi:MAG: glutamyl-tRNA reductase [Tannerella sp.]|jgi:glutamyl-tRNA reductase|nr:glutamyl-tRNA reductase [Tannerella sp.]
MINYKLINHSEYTLKERERMGFQLDADDAVPHVLLATCNRMELYWGEGAVPERALRHLYRVAAGLESALIGERAIQGQLKQAYLEALKKYHLSPHLNRLFQTAIHTGKRVRTETSISEGAVSHSQITVEILRHQNIDLRHKIISIIGVNKLTEDILKYLTARGAENIFLSNRHIEKAEELARQYNGTAMSLDKKRAMLRFTDVLICATSAPHIIVHQEDIEKDKKLLIFDLAFPRDVDESVGRFSEVTLYNLENIERFARENVSLRHKEIRKAEGIIEEEINKFYEWQSKAYERKNQFVASI